MALTIQSSDGETSDRLLRGQIEQLFEALRRVDGLQLGPVERMNAVAVTTMLRLRLGETVDPAGVEQLASALASVLAKTKHHRASVTAAAVQIFGEQASRKPIPPAGPGQRGGQTILLSPAHPVRVPIPYRSKLAVLALACTVAIGVYAMTANRTRPPLEPTSRGDFGQASNPSSLPPASATAGNQSGPREPLTQAEIENIAIKIADAGSRSKRATLWQLSGPLSNPGDLGRDHLATYKLLQLHSAINPAKPVDLTDPSVIERLVWAYLYVTVPTRSAEPTFVRTAAAQTAKLPKASSSAASLALPPSSQAYIAPWWLFWLTLSLPLLALGVRGAGFARRKRRYVERVLANGPGRASLDEPCGQVDPTTLRSERADLARIARHLHARAEVPTQQIDVERTIAATMAQAGLFTPRLGNLKVTPEYLALIATEGPDDQEANRLSYVIEQIGHHDLSVDRRYIEHDADRVFAGREERRISLATLHNSTPGHRLIVLGNGHGFLDPATHLAKPWTGDLARWQVRALATPVPFDEWGVRESRLSGLFDGPLFGTTARGLEMLAVYLRDRADADAGAIGYQTKKQWPWHFNPNRWTIDAPYMEDEAWAEIWPQLQSYLKGPHGDRRGIDWLAAVAVYPVIRWDLTSYLALRLTSVDALGAKRALYDDEIATRLSVLPWFRSGRMPDWLRQRLIAELAPPRRREIIGLIGELLVRAPLAPSGVRRERLPIATRGTGSGEVAIQQPRRPDDDLAANDRELLNLLEAERGSDQLLEGKQLKWPSYFAGSRVTLARQERAWGWLLAAYLVAALWLAPKPWSGAAPTGGWWGIAVLALSLVTLPLASLLAKRASAGVEAADREVG